jgi:hypothetical protein
VVVKNVRCVVSAVPRIVVTASLAVLATACSNGGTNAAGSTSPPTTSVAPVSTGSAAASTAPVTTVPATSVPATTVPATSVPASSPVPQPTPSATITTCATIAATRKFLYLTKAALDADGSLTVAGSTATMVCGGPDDFHFTFGTVTVIGHVPSSASLQVVGASQGPTPITLAKFPGYLATDHNTRVFIVTGPITGITGLTEQFHP